MQLATTKIQTSRFTYVPAANEFAAEWSDLHDLGEFIGRIYDDACDVGFTLVSAKTGREVVFGLSEYKRDREGDPMWAEFRPVNTDEWAAGRVRIYND